jgi:hypothetical protein
MGRPSLSGRPRSNTKLNPFVAECGIFVFNDKQKKRKLFARS